MSATQDPDTYTCGECNTTCTTTVADAYCSEHCRDKNTGRALLNSIRHDHTVCALCGTQLKELEKPPDTFIVGKGMQTAESIVGYQYQTPEADVGERVVSQKPGRETITTGTVCGECGNTDPSQRFPELEDMACFQYGESILSAVREKRREGVHEKELDDETFFETLRVERDVCVALGRAIDDD